MKMVKKWVKVIKKIDSEKETEIIFSGLIQSEDHVFVTKQKKSTTNSNASLKIIDLLRT